MKQIAILGSTGSIGKSALQVVEKFPREFRVRSLTTKGNTAVLIRQIKKFSPAFVCVKDPEQALHLEKQIGLRKTKIFVGDNGLLELLNDKATQKVVIAISGSAALQPLLRAIENRMDIALANKEALVMAGQLIMRMARSRQAHVIPIDSEQSAIWQCLKNEPRLALKRIYLTASGGSLRKASGRVLRNVSVSQVLRHPRWKMGAKITVDSATLMNKGLEVLEAMFLFGVGPDEIKVIIHPESIIHSMTEFCDGVILAQLSVTDMRIPIQYALSYPQRLTCSLAGVDFLALKALTFERPDLRRFPCLGLAYRAAKTLGTMPAVLNAANEVSVEEFLRRNLDFLSIARVIEKVMDRHTVKSSASLADILAADAWARREAGRIISQYN